MTPDEALRVPNVRAFLRAIRLGEGTADDDGYRRIVGGALIDSYADHPRRAVWIPRYRLASTAAGAYQFLARTWDEMRVQYRLADFSPRSQDRAAVGLLIRRRALDDVVAGRIEQAIGRCRLEWASLPGSPYGQRTESLARVLTEYERYGGDYGPLLVAGAAIPGAPEKIAQRPAEPPAGPPAQPPVQIAQADPRQVPIDESKAVYDAERGGWVPRA